jgi:hypothetical protein
VASGEKKRRSRTPQSYSRRLRRSASARQGREAHQGWGKGRHTQGPVKSSHRGRSRWRTPLEWLAETCVMCWCQEERKRRDVAKRRPTDKKTRTPCPHSVTPQHTPVHQPHPSRPSPRHWHSTQSPRVTHPANNPIPHRNRLHCIPRHCHRNQPDHPMTPDQPHSLIAVTCPR